MEGRSRMTRLQVLARRALAGLGFAACLAAATLPAAAQTPPAPSAPAATERELLVQNETDVVLMQFFLAPPDGSARSPDLLGADVVRPASTHRIRLGRVPACVFDAVAVFADGGKEVRRGLDICATPRLVFGDPALPTLDVAVANRSPLRLRELYASAAGPDAWGRDRLGRAVLPPGGRFALRMRTRDCVFDLRAVYEDNREELRERVDLCATREVAFDRSAVARPPARRIVLANRHLATVRQVYLSASTEADWGPDRLGDATLAMDEDVTVETTGGCTADLRIVFADGAAEERRAIDICVNTRVVLRPGWVVATRLDGEEEPAPAEAEPPGPEALRLRNAGALPIVEIYTPRPGAPRGEDRLGEDTLPIGATIEIGIADREGCAADLVVVFRDGREVTQRGLDLCAGEEIEIR
jgi:hypothetical protein